MMKFTCAVCGNDFVTEARRACYCCLACRVEGEKKKREEWRANNKERIKKTKSVYWKKRKERLAAEQKAAGEATGRTEAEEVKEITLRE